MTKAENRTSDILVVGVAVAAAAAAAADEDRIIVSTWTYHSLLS